MLTTCTKLGQPQSALAVYDKMCADGVAPTTKTFTTLISAFSKVTLPAKFGSDRQGKDLLGAGTQ